MFQTAIGRIHSPILSPSGTLDMKIFLDAGGKAGRQRVWGGLATIGESELPWIKKILDELGNDTHNSEIKGRNLLTSEITNAGRKILEQKRRILFWANWFPDCKKQDSQNLSDILTVALKEMRPNKYHLEQRTIKEWYDSNAQYFASLKTINKYKIVSIVAHIQWLIGEISRRNVGHQLRSVEVVIDRENFPDEGKCGLLIKTFLAAALQSVGMSCSLTGRAFRELANEGAVTVDVSGESESSVGIRYVDILLQVVLRKVQPIPEDA